MRWSGRCGHALVEWALCVPVFVAVIAFVFGFLFLVFGQLCLEHLCDRTVEKLCRSDAADESALSAEAAAFIAGKSSFRISTHLDQHIVLEKSGLPLFQRPPLRVIGLELSWAPAALGGPSLRSYRRGARNR